MTMSKFKQASVILEKNYSVVFKLNTRSNNFLNSVTKRVKSTAAPAAETIPGIPYTNLTIGVPKEVFLNEKRVAITPAVTEIFTKKGFKVLVEENAGVLAKFPNDTYAAAGASIVNAKEVYSSADIVLKVRSPDVNVSYIAKLTYT